VGVDIDHRHPRQYARPRARSIAGRGCVDRPRRPRGRLWPCRACTASTTAKRSARSPPSRFSSWSTCSKKKTTRIREYYIDADTLELFSDNNCDPELLAMIEGALDDGEDGVDIGWE
jgi:hypothetical protein